MAGLWHRMFGTPTIQESQAALVRARGLTREQMRANDTDADLPFDDFEAKHSITKGNDRTLGEYGRGRKVPLYKR